MPTQPTKGLTEGGYFGGEGQVDVPRSAKPFRIAGLSNRHLNYNWDCAYANEFPVAVEVLDVDARCNCVF
jgi:hypothetical protein